MKSAEKYYHKVIEYYENKLKEYDPKGKMRQDLIKLRKVYKRTWRWIWVGLHCSTLTNWRVYGLGSLYKADWIIDRATENNDIFKAMEEGKTSLQEVIGKFNGNAADLVKYAEEAKWDAEMGIWLRMCVIDHLRKGKDINWVVQAVVSESPDKWEKEGFGYTFTPECECKHIISFKQEIWEIGEDNDDYQGASWE